MTDKKRKASENVDLDVVLVVSWDDVPHLSSDDKTDMRDALPSHQRGPRSTGVPEEDEESSHVEEVVI